MGPKAEMWEHSNFDGGEFKLKQQHRNIIAMIEASSPKLAPKSPKSTVQGRSKKLRPNKVAGPAIMECQVVFEATASKQKPNSIQLQSTASGHKSEPQEDFEQWAPLFEKRHELYEPDPALLVGTAVTPLMRALLFEWLIKNCYQRLFMRQTLALACCYVDLYLQRNPKVTKNNLQLLGFTALFVAAKLQQSQIPCFSVNLFNQADVIRLQRDICLSLGFRLNPDTYIHTLNSLMSSWDSYCTTSPCSTLPRFFTASLPSYQQLRTVYDLADCLYLDIRSLEFDRLELLVSLLYLVIRKFHMRLGFAFLKFSEFQFEYLREDELYGRFAEFLGEVLGGEVTVGRNREIARHLYPFLGLEIDLENRSQSDSYSEYVSAQNYNPRSFELVKSIIESRRKS